MKIKLLYSVITSLFLLLLVGCTTKKNAFANRQYHNITARYNGYYYATESIKDGEFNIKTSYKYDYDQLLPLFLVPSKETAQSTFPDFDKAILKSSTSIKKHTITNKGVEVNNAGRWIDNNWIVIGISHFYKREFFPAIEAFEYVVRSYDSQDKYKAMIWLAKCYNEIGAPSQVDPILRMLKEDKKISNYAARELPIVQADYYIKRGMNDEAEKALVRALIGAYTKKTKYLSEFFYFINRPAKGARARFNFVLGQLHEEKKENKKAILYYKKVITLKPDYNMVFNAKMKLAKLFDVKTGNVGKLKRDLLAMTRDSKNLEYLDAIYYALGEIYERENNQSEAINCFKLSIKNSLQNPKQKALSYLKLGDIQFDLTNYVLSGNYYDSTLITLPKEYKHYAVISKRKETLETLVGYIKTIQREDSLQKIANMSVSDRTRFIEKMQDKIDEEELRNQEAAELKALQNTNSNNPSAANSNLPNVGTIVKGDWYFYNPTTVSFGMNDFIKKWGNIKLEDNWRRSQKAMTTENQEVKEDSITDKTITKGKTKTSSRKPIDSYLVNLPLSDSLKQVSNKIIIDAYYNLASTYKEELGNNTKAISTYEELNSRFADHKYKLSTFYQLYVINTSIKNKPRSEYYKNKLLNEYPTSEYAQIIKNPKYIAEKNTKKGEIELFYTDTYNDYSTGNYEAAFTKSNQSELKFGRNDYAPKFEFIKAMSIGKLKGVDSLDASLKKVVIYYPKHDVAKKAQEILDVISKLKSPKKNENASSSSINKKDTFNLDLNSEHVVVAICQDNAEMVNVFKSALANYNSTFYSNSNLQLTTSLFGSSNQITNIGSFKSAEEAVSYITNLKKDKSVFNDKVPLQSLTLAAVSKSNVPLLYKKNDVNFYMPFYSEHYNIK